VSRNARLSPQIAHLAAGLLLFGSTLVRADDERPDAVPNRPTVSTTADLSAPGWLEGELGGLYQRDRHPDADPIRRASLPYSLKLAFSREWGVRVDGEAVVRPTGDDGTRVTGFGDTTFVVKRRFEIDDQSAAGLEMSTTAPTSKKTMGAHIGNGSGKPDYTINTIYSADRGDWHGDLNLAATRIGARGTDEGRWQSLGALDISRKLGSRWGAVVEVSGTHRRGVPGTAQVLGAVTCAIERSVVVDVGIAHALNRATPTWQAFFGVTAVLGRVF
jgi:hypothetical protein